MRFQSIEIRNLRAIREFSASGLADLVLIAGPNGCGKSCILDAIRLLKSVYGGYQSNEWMQWFGEFQVNLQDVRTLENIFRDADLPIEIKADIELAQSEREYIGQHAYQLCEPIVWAEETRTSPETFQYSALAYAAQFPQLVPRIAQQTAAVASDLIQQSTAASHHLALTLHSDGRIETAQSLTARIIFQTYDPDHLGLIEFHSASRTYMREALGGINLDVQAVENQRRSQRLYNWQGKYQNIKAEIATMFLRALIAKDAGGEVQASEDLDGTLKELFATFFPDKEYLGVQSASDGSVSFPVQLATGEIHDINELSSGEKEVVYGYLRLQSVTPSNSTILLDEPELHLNPGLLQGFPDFYYRHISLAKETQLWLVTHSDALLRQAVGNPNFTVIHMTTASSTLPGVNQAIVVGEDDLGAALLDLVGDLAAYRPTGKVVIFEGGGDTEFDVSAVTRLFPEFASRVNLVSGGSKGRVKEVYRTLQRTAEATGLADRFYAIVDRDSESVASQGVPDEHVISWDVYHIENYLLDPRFVLAAYLAIAPSPVLHSSDEVLNALRKIAEENVMRLVLIKLQDRVNSDFVNAINVGAPPDVKTPAVALEPSIKAAFERLDVLRLSVGDPKVVGQWQTEIESELRTMLATDEWRSNYPGRVLLKAFVDRYLSGGVSYDHFVTLIMNQMVTQGHRPEGMAQVLARIAPIDSAGGAGAES